MPVLYLLAGPNGTGKTTFHSIAVQSSLISANLPFVNVDLIVQSLGQYSEENLAKALEIYRSAVKEYLAVSADFMIESNLAESRDYDWMAAMKRNRYEAVLYYLSTDDVEINIGRVKRRVSEGGHDIPEAIIRSRYSQSHSYLKTKLIEFKEAYLIDNSTEIFEVQAHLINGRIIHKSPAAAQWIQDVLSLTERLQNKLNQ